MSRDGGIEEGELIDLQALLQLELPEEDSEPVPEESSHDKALRWLDELVLNVKLTDNQVIEVAKVYTLQDLIGEIRLQGGRWPSQ